VRAGRGADLLPHGLQPDATEQVVGRRGGQQRQHDGGEQEAQHEPLEGVGEGEVGDVAAELRVDLAELRAVAPQQPGLPAGGGRQPGEQAEDARADEQHRGEERLDGDAVALEVLLLRRHRPERRPHPVGQVDVHPDDDGHEQPEAEEEHQAGGQDGREDLPVINAREPQQVGVQRDADTAHQEQDGQDHEDGSEQAGAGRQARPGGADGHAGRLLVRGCCTSNPSTPRLVPRGAWRTGRMDAWIP